MKSGRPRGRGKAFKHVRGEASHSFDGSPPPRRRPDLKNASPKSGQTAFRYPDHRPLCPWEGPEEGIVGGAQVAARWLGKDFNFKLKFGSRSFGGSGRPRGPGKPFREFLRSSTSITQPCSKSGKVPSDKAPRKRAPGGPGPGPVDHADFRALGPGHLAVAWASWGGSFGPSGGCSPPGSSFAPPQA